MGFEAFVGHLVQSRLRKYARKDHPYHIGEPAASKLLQKARRTIIDNERKVRIAVEQGYRMNSVLADMVWSIRNDLVDSLTAKSNLSMRCSPMVVSPVPASFDCLAGHHSSTRDLITL